MIIMLGYEMQDESVCPNFSLTFGAVPDHAQAHVKFHVNFHFSSLVKEGSGGWYLCEAF